MRTEVRVFSKLTAVGTLVLIATIGVNGIAQRSAAPPPKDDPIRPLVGRLALEKYKATIKGLTEFGDRRQGTDRNRAAIDWIEAQLVSYGCNNTERLTYVYTTPPPTPPPAGQQQQSPPQNPASSSGSN